MSEIESWEYEVGTDAWYIICNGRRVMKVLVDKDESPLLADAVVRVLTIGTQAIEAQRARLQA